MCQFLCTTISISEYFKLLPYAFAKAEADTTTQRHKGLWKYLFFLRGLVALCQP